MAPEGPPPPRGTISDDRLRSDANNLTLVRLLLASGVIWTHCYGLITGHTGYDELAAWLGRPVSFLAVNGFFFLSGFLICRSAVGGRSVLGFVRNRLARIWPGLALCVVLTVLAFGWWSGMHAAYWSDPLVRRFVWRNLTLVQAAYALPAPPHGAPTTANGSLWTISWELRCYAAMALLFALPLARRASVALVALLAFLALCAGWALYVQMHFGGDHAFSGKLYLVDTGLRLGACFATGALAYLSRARISLSWWVLLALWVAAVVAFRVSGLWVLASFALYYSVLCIAFLPWPAAMRLRALPDYSYGIYIYAFPVMVLMQAWLGADDHARLAGATLAATLPLAALSWHLVGAPALAWARRRGAIARRASPA